jgi:RimJ/RimL family protein N-acetyltransferase
MKKIVLRKFSDGDLPELVRLLNNANVSKYTSDRIPYPYTEEDGKKFLLFMNEAQKDHFFAVTAEGKLIGGGGIHHQTMNLSRNVEIGYWLGEEYWGKGYAKELVKELLMICFTLPEIHKVFARTIDGNIASEKALSSNGFVPEGILKEHVFKRGRFYDEKYWGLLKGV